MDLLVDSSNLNVTVLNGVPSLVSNVRAAILHQSIPHDNSTDSA